MTWPMVPLGEVATIDRKSVTPENLSKNTLYVGLENIERGGRIASVTTAEKADIRSSKFRFTDNHILFGKLRPNLGKIAAPNFSGVCSTDILPVMPSSRLDRNFLLHYLRQPSMVSYAATRTTGANLPRLSPNTLASFPVPLISLAEQRRIAAILDQADATFRLHRSRIDLLDTLPRSLFNNTFGPPQSWDVRWDMTTIGDSASSVDYGTSKKSGPVGEWPILRMGNLTDDGRLDLSDLKYSNLITRDVEKYRARRGDLLFNRTNSLEKVGKTAVVHSDEKLALAGYLIRVRFDQPGLADFVSAYLNSVAGRALRRSLAKAAVNQANISASQLRQIAIPQLPDSLLDEFANRLAEIRRQREHLETSLAVAESLGRALQARAFRGEL